MAVLMYQNADFREGNFTACSFHDTHKTVGLFIKIHRPLHVSKVNLDVTLSEQSLILRVAIISLLKSSVMRPGPSMLTLSDNFIQLITSPGIIEKLYSLNYRQTLTFIINIYLK